MNPCQAANLLRLIAAQIDNSLKPSKILVAKALKLAILELKEPKTEMDLEKIESELGVLDVVHEDDTLRDVAETLWFRIKQHKTVTVHLISNLDVKCVLFVKMPLTPQQIAKWVKAYKADCEGD